MKLRPAVGLDINIYDGSYALLEWSANLIWYTRSKDPIKATVLRAILSCEIKPNYSSVVWDIYGCGSRSKYGVSFICFNSIEFE